MGKVTLNQMLEAREIRVQIQQTLLKKYGQTLICFTMNIPGPVKMSPQIERAFKEGCDILDYRLPQEHILHREIHHNITGCEAFYVIEYDAVFIKQICTSIEDDTILGRLFDMDVLDCYGNKLNRTLVGGKSRDCIVCGASGRGCASRRLHTVEELQNVTTQIIKRYFAKKDCEAIASLAVQSLLDEVCTTPKPGLVDRCNSGSHNDMDIFTFTSSAAALHPYFLQCFEIGQETRENPFEETFALLRSAGLRAEQRMYQITGGVNTHKGAIYTMGVACGALGRLWKVENPIAHTEEIQRVCSQLVTMAVENDFSRITHAAKADTAGQQLYLKYGLTGIRGEVADGFPSISTIALPVFYDCLKRNLCRNDAGAITLLHLIANVSDTNLYHRGGQEGARYAAQAASTLLKKTPYPSVKQVSALDDEFICRNLSPGGCADLLAVTYFFVSLQNGI